LRPASWFRFEITYDEPGSHTYLGLDAYTDLELDPGNRVKESNEANNELALGYLPQLTCVIH